MRSYPHKNILLTTFFFISGLTFNNSAQNLKITESIPNTIEGQQNSSFTISLDAAPNETFPVLFQLDRSDEIILSQSSINFTPLDYGEQTINIYGQTDGIVDGNQTTTISFIQNESVLETREVINVNADQSILSIEATNQASEGGNDGLFTIISSAVSLSDTEITIDITGTATNGNDFNTIPTTITLPANANSVTIPVNVIDDNIIEEDETVIVTLKSTNNSDVTIGSPINATVTIADNDANATISIEATNQASEGGNDGLFTITSSAISLSDTEITIDITGTATNGNDFNTIPTTITLPANANSVTIPVNVIDDNIIEEDENVIVTLKSTNNSDVTIDSPSNATVTIADNDANATISLEATNQASEGGNDGLFTITSSAVSLSDTEITIDITGTATNGTDFNTIPTTITLPANANSVTIPVNVIDDNIIEEDENVIVTLKSTNNSDVTVDSPTNATVTISDNDANATISIEATNQASEGGNDGLFTITSSAISLSDTEITIDITGAATNGTDFNTIPTTITLPANANSVTIPVNVIDDNIIEEDENVIVTLKSTNNSDVTVDSPTNATVTISDNDANATISIEATNQASEGGNDGLFTITSSAVSLTDTEITIDITGTATNGTDFNTIPTTITLPASANSVTIPVDVIDDNIIEEDENVIVTLKSTNNSDVTIDSPSNATVTIADNDANATISIEATTQASEGGNDGLFTINSSAISLSDTEIAIDITGTATNGTDFNTIPTTITLPANANSVTIPVDIIDDNIIEEDETVIITLKSTNNSDVIVSSQNQATVTINDNDANATISIEATNQASEGGNDGLFTITSSAISLSDTEITIDITGAATYGTDFNTIPTTITLPANTNSVTIPVNVIDDNIIEEDENVIVTLKSTNNSDVTIGSPINATVTIADNDANATISIEATTQASEGGNDGLFTINSSAISLSDTEITIDITGTATNGTDFNTIPTTITLPASANSVTIPVDVIDDNIIEENETVIVTLKSTNNSDVTIDSPTNATVTIADNDANATISIEATNQASEGGNDGLFTITSSAVSLSDTEITIDITGTATNGTDFNTIPTTITLPASANSVTIPVDVIDDNIIEEDETVIVTLKSTNNSDVTIDSPTNATVTISDNDANATISIEATTQASEGGNDGLFTINSSAISQSETIINLQISGSATNGTDYNTIASAITLPANASSVTIPVTAIDDNIIEGGETISIKLITTNNEDVIVSSQNQATVTINDNDYSASLSIDATTDASENGTNGVFTINASAVSLTDTEISFNVSGSAINGQDYQIISSPVILPASATSVAIPVEVIADRLVENNETVIITLTNTNNNDLTIGLQNQATLTIEDNDVAGVNLSASSLIINEGSSISFTMTLTAQPTSDVIINLLNDNTGAATVLPADVTFTSSNWQNPKTITVYGIEDDNLINEKVTISASIDPASNEHFINLANEEVTISIIDEDFADFTVSPNPLEIAEGGSGTFSVVLNAQPQNNVVINLENDNTNATSFALDPITFTSENWDVAQQVSVTGVEDFIAENKSSLVTLSVNNAESDDDFNDIIKNITINVTDNETPNLVLSASELSINEGSDDIITILLTSKPTSSVTINLSSNNEDAVSLSNTQITFDNSNWNIAQTLTINTLEDDNVVDESVIITASVAAESDVNYVNLAPKTINVSVTDNDTADLLISVSTIEMSEDENKDFTVGLSAQPTQDVTVLVNNSNTNAATTSANTLTFTSSNWDTPQSITIDANIDNDTNNETVKITLGIDSNNSDPDFTSIGDKTVMLYITDDDVPAYSISINEINVTEGNNDSFTISMATKPSSTVSFNITSNNENSTELQPSSVSFTTDTWNTPQSIKVTALQDNNFISETVTITVKVNSSSDLDYRYLANQIITVNIADNDTPPVFTSEPITEINKNELYSYSVSTSDEDGDIPVLAASNLPEWLNFIDNQDGTGLLEGTPLNQHVANSPYENIMIEAKDPIVSISQEFSITVNNTNTAPVATDDYASVFTNNSISTNVVNNDYDVDENLNINSITIINQPSNGNVEIETGTGYINYTPNTDFTGDDQYTYSICDEEQECAQATVYITISIDSNIPETEEDDITVEEDRSITIYPLSNDTEPVMGWDLSSLSILIDPQFGSAQLNIDNSSIKYTPDDDYFGNDTIVYHICDNAATQTCAFDTIFIEVYPINDAPIAQDDYMTVKEGEVAELDLTLNDDDIETPHLLWVRIADYTPDIKGTAVILEDRKTLRFTAAYNCGCNQEIVDYILEDGTGAISGGRVFISIEKASDNIPKVFSPNGDGIDDFFVVPGIGTDEYDTNELYIFNRWGGQIYYMKNYDNTWDGKSVDSAMGSDELPEGTYFYVFKLSDGRIYKGTVYLKR
nr:Calx-beta domain-containing protein [uncultured Carboxylicivirga sp.]